MEAGTTNITEQTKFCGAPSFADKYLNRLNSNITKKVIDHWQGHQLRKIAAIGTKSYSYTIKVINQVEKGDFFYQKGFEDDSHRPYSLDEIKLSIDRFALAANDAYYFPVVKQYLKKLELSRFFYDPFSNDTKSYFLKFLQYPPKKRVEDQNVQLTQYLMGQYRRTVIAGTPVKFCSETESKLAFASKRLKEFFTKNKSKISPGFAVNDLSMAKWLMDAVVFDVKEVQRITPGYLCSNETFERRLPVYLLTQAIMTGR